MLLGINVYLILGIAIVIGLVALFFVSYILNKRTPVPEGCENVKPDVEACKGCNITDCSVKQELDFEKIKEEIKEENEK